MGGVGFLLCYNQHLVICYKTCLQTCFTNFWKGKLLKIRKEKFHMQNNFPLLFFRNTNEYEHYQMLPNIFNLLEKISKLFSVEKI